MNIIHTQRDTKWVERERRKRNTTNEKHTKQTNEPKKIRGKLLFKHVSKYIPHIAIHRVSQLLHQQNNQQRASVQFTSKQQHITYICLYIDFFCGT